MALRKTSVTNIPNVGTDKMIYISSTGKKTRINRILLLFSLFLLWKKYILYLVLAAKYKGLKKSESRKRETLKEL